MSGGPLSRIRRIVFVSAAALVVAVGGYLLLYVVGGPVDFDDPGMEEAVRAAIGDESGEIHRNDLEQLTHLDASGAGITELSDVALMPNLRTLDLSRNRPQTLSPLSRLRRLEELRLGDTGLRSAAELDLPDLAALRNLRRLDLQDNRELDEIGALVELDTLRELSLRNTAVEEIAPLARLSELRVLDLRETELGSVDLAPLANLGALERLNLRDTGVRDIAPLSELTGLRYLNVHSNPGIKTLEPLRDLTRLRTLILRNVPMDTELDVIAGMRNLRRLNIRNTGVRDLTVLAELMKRDTLQDDPDGGIQAEVDIRDNPISGDPAAGPSGYDVLRPYWGNISARYPERLPRAPTGEVLINEVMTSNGTTLVDERGEYPDWVELHNPGDSTIDIGGYFLSSDPDEPTRFRLPADTRVAPGGYLLVFASGREGEGRDTAPASDEVTHDTSHADRTLHADQE
ncbi:MAG: leucine-rich repeat domain-containing protein, partial [Spirochaetota bacterium]